MTSLLLNPVGDTSVLNLRVALKAIESLLKNFLKKFILIEVELIYNVSFSVYSKVIQLYSFSIPFHYGLLLPRNTGDS